MIFRNFRQYGVKPKVWGGRAGGRKDRAERAAADLSSSGLGLCSRAVASQPGRPEGRENPSKINEKMLDFQKIHEMFFWFLGSGLKGRQKPMLLVERYWHFTILPTILDER